MHFSGERNNVEETIRPLLRSKGNRMLLHIMICSWLLDVLTADNRAIFDAASHAQRAAHFINGLQPASAG
jgi:antirestriction protein ArdC